jgi:beta-glucanase (GH16 family)
MRTFKLWNYEWLEGYRSGLIWKPDQPRYYLSHGNITYPKDELHLITSYNPYPEGQKPKYAAGLVTSVQDFTYGTFEFTFQLPKGKHLWPAIWLLSSDSPYREIDIMEAYSGRCNYRSLNPFKSRRIETNIHWGEPIVSHAGARRYIFRKSATRSPITIKCVWTYGMISFYINGKFSHTYYSYIRGPMHLVIDNKVTSEKKDKKSSMFTITSFKYTG